MDVLQDGILDGWVYRAWNGATRIYSLDDQEALPGEHAVRVERTNASGGTALS